MSSVIFRGWLASARQDEWEANTGALLTFRTSQNVWSETCEMSTIMPARFIASITWRPRGASPP